MNKFFTELLKTANETLFIIGEAGVNHNGSFEKAIELVDAAKEAGCDAVKFQTWITEKVYSEEKSIKPEYQVNTTAAEKTEYQIIKELELSFEQFRALKNYCDSKGILFLSTPDEIDSAKFLANDLKLPLLKTASQDVTNTFFLKQVSNFKLPVIFSTGASTLAEITDAMEAIASVNDQVIPLHCISSYPAPINQLNLNFIPTLKALSAHNCVGFSDHTTGTEAACAALALGARVFEKHFTLDKTMEGPDHQASLEPDELKAYCTTLRELHKGLGNGKKSILPCEENTRKAFRRFFVLSRDIPAGHCFSEDDFNLQKVVHGIEPSYFDKIKLAKSKQPLKKNHILEWNDLEF